MTIEAVWISVDPERLLETLRQQEGAGEVLLDFADVQRIDTAAAKALEELAGRGKVVLRRVNVDVYRVLKLLGLTPKLSFE